MKKIQFLFICFLLVLNVRAQTFYLDTTFVPQFSFYDQASNTVNQIGNIIVHTNGKITCSGSYRSSFFPSPYENFVRFFPDGRIDSSYISSPFHTESYSLRYEHNTYFVNGFTYFMLTDTIGNLVNKSLIDTIYNRYNFNLSDFYIYPDNKFLFFGEFMSSRGEFTGQKKIARLNSNGFWDSTFNHFISNTPLLYYKLSDNKILVSFNQNTVYDNVNCGNIIKIDTSGNLDTSFKSPIVYGTGRPGYEDAQHRIYVTGFLVLDGHPNDTVGLIRLMPNGALDTTFNNFVRLNTATDAALGAICPTDDGGFLIGGTFTSYQGYRINCLAKIDSSGNVDTNALAGFSGADSLTFLQAQYPPTIYWILKEPQGSYLVAGWFDRFNGRRSEPIVRIRPIQVGTKEIQPEIKCTLYPVPATGNQNVVLQTNLRELHKNLRLIAFDFMGRKVFDIPLQNEKTNLPFINSGMFKVVVMDENGNRMWHGTAIVND